MLNPKEILLQSLNWAENSPDSTRTIIEWSDRQYGLNKFWYSVHLLRLASESFQRPLRIAICGENNSGKSTLVNALIREEIAVTDFFEFTFCPMVFSYDDQEQAKIVYNSDAILDLNLTDLETKMRNLHANNELKNIKRIEVTAPKHYLKKYQIADVPGLGADERNAQIAKSFTEEIDIVVFVLNASLLGESRLIEDIQKLAEQFSHLCIVINKIDQIGYENSDEAVGFIAEQSFGIREIPIFPMAAADIINNSTAQKWLTDLEEQFFKPVAEDGETIKIIQALEKGYRQVSTISLFLQSTYHQSNRHWNLVKISNNKLTKKIDFIVQEINQEVDTWVKYKGFIDLVTEYIEQLRNKQIKSEIEARKELEKFLSEINIKQEVEQLIDILKKFVEAEISKTEIEIKGIYNQIIAPFQIEETSNILKDKYGQNPSILTYNIKNNEIKDRAIFNQITSESPQVKSNSIILAGSLITTQLLTTIELIGEMTLLPIITGGIGLVIPVVRIITANWEHIHQWFKPDTTIDEQKLQQDLEIIRFKLAQEIVKKVLPKGAKDVIEPSLKRQFQQWQNKAINTLWNPTVNINQDLSDLATYIKQGEEIRSLMLDTLTKKFQSPKHNFQNQDILNLSPAAVKAQEIFNSPRYYRVTEVESLQHALAQVIELEEVQLSFIDRYCNSYTLLWLGQVASPQAFIQGWIYDVENDSEDRVKFIETLNQQKIKRNDAISIQIIKYTSKNGTPLNRYLITGRDWVIELSQSLAELGKKDFRVCAIVNNDDQSKTLELIKNYSTFNSVLQRSGTSDIQSLTL